MTSTRSLFASLQRESPHLLGGAACNLLLLAVSLGGLALDPRIITGAPAWLKPAKFCVSAFILLLSLAMMTRDLPKTRLLRSTNAILSWLLTAEVFVICVQASRGTTSHFNIDTTFDATVFASMGIAIATVWLCLAVILWLHWRTPAADRAMAIALRLGLALNILGAGVGWTMTRPFPGQLEAIESGVRPRIAGSHTVGGTDGGAGLPLTQWSTAHGDLRVPHFFLMHALQLLPLLLLIIRAARGAQRQSGIFDERAIMVAACLYLVVGALLLQQALRGVPLIPS